MSPESDSQKALAQFAGQQYLSLESYRRTGEPIRTPVWFAEGDGVFYMYTRADSFKVKRIRRNPQVRVVPCDVRGRVTGEWVEATAAFLDDAGARRAHELLNRKYGFIKRLFDWLFNFSRHERLALAIQFPRQTENY